MGLYLSSPIGEERIGNSPPSSADDETLTKETPSFAQPSGLLCTSLVAWRLPHIERASSYPFTIILVSLILTIILVSLVLKQFRLISTSCGPGGREVAWKPALAQISAEPGYGLPQNKTLNRRCFGKFEKLFCGAPDRRRRERTKVAFLSTRLD